MNAPLQTIIDNIQGADEVLCDLLDKPMWISGERGIPPNRATQDDYEMVASLDHLEPGGFK